VTRVKELGGNEIGPVHDNDKSWVKDKMGERSICQTGLLGIWGEGKPQFDPKKEK